MMNQYIIEAVLGLISGFILGVTGILPVGVILLMLDYLNIGDYRSKLGALLFLIYFVMCDINNVYFILYIRLL